MIRRLDVRILLTLGIGWLSLTIAVCGWCEPSVESIREETSIRYCVKQGDTLWDIAKRFWDSPLRWPDVWGMNPQISNPHRIFPGDPILLYKETTTETATLPEEAPQPLPETPDVEKPAAMSAIFVFRGMDRVGFLREKPLEPIARIVMQQSDRTLNRKLWSQGDTLYAAAEGEDLVPGRTYRVYKIMGPYRVPIGGKRQNVFQHYINGIVSAVRSEGNRIWLVRIEAAYAPIMAGDMLMPCEDRSEHIPIVETPKGIEGRILFSQDHHQIFSAGFLAFIDKGLTDGIDVGQRLILVQEDMPESTSVVVPFGECLVLAVEQTTASIWITKSDRTLNDMAMVRSPQDVFAVYSLAKPFHTP